MERYFNTTGKCRPEIHYMVNLDERLAQIKRLYIDRGEYFIINRGRQYGKTTTLRALGEYLKDDHMVVSLDFQAIGTEEFVDAQTFTRAFALEFMSAAARTKQGKDDKLLCPLAEYVEQGTDRSLRELFVRLSRICAAVEVPVILMIDEVDSASNNQVFIDFLAQLRRYYLNREELPTFHSVILAGVYDIKNLKTKIRPDADHQYNSPWNIAANFDIDMAFSAEQIAAMLREYEADHETGMNIGAVAEEIYQYTSGYPYLVSAICKYMDEKMTGDNTAVAWTGQGIVQAVSYILKENLPLFGSMFRHIEEYPEIRKILYDILFGGEAVVYNRNNRAIDLAGMFGYIKNCNGKIQISNRIFETSIYDYFLSEEELGDSMSAHAKQNPNQFIKGAKLDMDRVLEKFVEHFTDVYGDNDEKFVEAYGRKFFLLYLKPIINGTGNYYVEAQTRDAGRTDVVVDYHGEQFVVELKIWRGNEYNERGEEQLAGYLDFFHRKKGYLLSFNFNKKKEVGLKTITVGDKMIVEAVV